MKVERQIQFWLGTALILAVLLWLLSSVLLPFAAGMTLAYLLDPIATRLQRMGMSRLVASLLIVGISGLLIFSAVIAFLPLLLKQAAQFLERLPAYAGQLADLIGRYGEQIGGRLQPVLDYLGLQPASGDADPSLPKPGDLVGQGAKWLGTLLSSLWQGGQALVGVASLLVITPVVTFYLLLDWRRLLTTLDNLVPVHHREIVRGLAREIDAAMAGFIRGQSFVCLFLGLWYGLGFTMVGLNFGMLIGITAGFLSFIPYVGSLVGLILSVGVAIVQGPGWGLLAMVLAVQFSGQFIEGNILTPRFVGGAVGLHPVWIMFALLAFGSLFGITGLILAVPIAAVIGVLTRFGVGQYRASPLYTGEQRRLPKDADEFP
ncbi:MAG: AI-2E family transporter [Beijerinckiaceae bacterium]|nr:AI-2E family transporter [Beijerinckiaceae bacterium]